MSGSAISNEDKTSAERSSSKSSAERSSSEFVAAILLRLGGAFMLLAFAAALLPTSWMAWSHARLGLGELPASPLVEYLTRSVSLLYGIHGGLYLVVASDVRRYAGVLKYLAAMNIVFGAAMVAIDLRAGLPWFWTLAEGPPVLAFGVLLLVLLRSFK
ncbi:MAG: hypothetical protein GY719_26365 [bacterium]|nr:hypothetical protein [bacterium]